MTALSSIGQSYEKLIDKMDELYKEGKYAEAVPIAIKVNDFTKETFGDTSIDYANSLTDLAMLYQKTGEYTVAEPLYQKALDIKKRLLKEDDPSYVRCINDLAACYDSMGNFANAERLYKQALAIIKKSLGEEHPDFANSLVNLLNLYVKTGNYEALIPIYKQALAILGKDVRDDPIYLLTLKDTLARLYADGKYLEAIPVAIKINVGTQRKWECKVNCVKGFFPPVLPARGPGEQEGIF